MHIPSGYWGRHHYAFISFETPAPAIDLDGDFRQSLTHPNRTRMTTVAPRRSQFSRLPNRMDICGRDERAERPARRDAFPVGRGTRATRWTAQLPDGAASSAFSSELRPTKRSSTLHRERAPHRCGALSLKPLAEGKPYAASSSSSSAPSTGPESRPLASTSRSTSSMIAIGAASEARKPALTMRV